MDAKGRANISKGMKKYYQRRRQEKLASLALIPLSDVPASKPTMNGRNRPRAEPSAREQIAMKLMLTVETILKGHDK